MKLQKRICRIILTIMLVINAVFLPVSAANDVAMTSIEPRFNNIFSATLTIGFDANNIAYLGISVSPYSHCTGFDGIMRLYDANGNQLKSWSISDFSEPYSSEKTWQCEEGKTYTVTFQGYAYGTNSMYDDINLSVTDTCE